MLLTDRMRLIPATAALARAEIEDRAAFAALLDAVIPDNWPPELAADALHWFLEQLEADADASGWFGWYGVVRGEGEEPSVLAAGAGFIGRPAGGTVETGYSVLPQYQRNGYATEMVTALIEWAQTQPGVERIVAEADTANTPSVRLLCRLGFTEIGAGREPGHRRFEKIRAGLMRGQ